MKLVSLTACYPAMQFFMSNLYDRGWREMETPLSESYLVRGHPKSSTFRAIWDETWRRRQLAGLAAIPVEHVSEGVAEFLDVWNEFLQLRQVAVAAAELRAIALGEGDAQVADAWYSAVADAVNGRAPLSHKPWAKTFSIQFGSGRAWRPERFVARLLDCDCDKYGLRLMDFLDSKVGEGTREAVLAGVGPAQLAEIGSAVDRIIAENENDPWESAIPSMRVDYLAQLGVLRALLDQEIDTSS